MAEEWTGSRWRLVKVPSSSSDFSDLYSISCLRPTRCLAAGAIETQHTLAERWKRVLLAGADNQESLTPIRVAAEQSGVFYDIKMTAGDILTALPVGNWTFYPLYSGKKSSYPP